MNDDRTTFLRALEATISRRKEHPHPDSYTTGLFAAGPERIAQKVGEEAVELAIASVAANRDRIISESADLLFHLLVLLREHGLGLDDVVRELENRKR